MSKKKGTQAAASKMTASAGKDSRQQDQYIESPLDTESLREIIKQVMTQTLVEAEQRIIAQLGTKIDNLEKQISGTNKRITDLKKRLSK